MQICSFIGPQEIIIILIVIVIVIPLLFIIPIVALIDILKNKFSGNDKLIWVLVVLFLPFIGSVLYFIIGRKQKINNKTDF